MAYNLTEISQNTTGIVTLMQGVNNVLMDGWLGTLFLIGISAVIFISLQLGTQNLRYSIIATTFTAFGFSLFLAAMQLVPSITIFITLIGAAAAVGFSFVSN